MKDKKEPYTSPTDKEVKDHWKAQDTSVFRKPKSRDNGLTIIDSADQVGAIIEAEIIDGPQNTFKSKTPSSITISDPVLQVQSMIRLSRDMTADDFMLECSTPLELALYEYLFGDMKPAQRAQGLLNLQKLLFQAQQEVNKQVNMEKAREERKEERLRKMIRRMKNVTDKSSKGDE